MDIDSLTKGIGLVSTTITTLKKLKELIPSGDKKQVVEQKLEEAKKNIKIAEAEIAKGFNFQLCHRHFPPENFRYILYYKFPIILGTNVIILWASEQPTRLQSSW